MLSARCEACGTAVYGSDIFCCGCGLRQRGVDLHPATLVVVAETAAAKNSAELLSRGQVVVQNTSRQDVRVLGVRGAAGLRARTTPELPKERPDGLSLASGDELLIWGEPTGEPVSGDLQIDTSIGPFQLPVRNRSVPELTIDRVEFGVPRGPDVRLGVNLSIAKGEEDITLTVEGPGLRVDKFRVRLEAGTPCPVTLRATPADCFQAGAVHRLRVELSDGTPLGFPLTLTEVGPARLVPLEGPGHLEVRLFAGEVVRRRLSLRNVGGVPYPLEHLSLTDATGKPLRGVRVRALNALERPTELPLAVEPGQSVSVEVECEEQGPGGLQEGTLRLAGPGVQDLLAAVVVDSREPAAYRLPVGLDFGTSACAVATRSIGREERGAVATTPFTFEGQPSAPFMTSDVQILAPATGDQPLFRIDPGATSTRELGVARNLKRRVGLGKDHEEHFETVYWNGRRHQFTAEELALFVIREMKRQAEHHLGKRLLEASATVPSSFSLRRVHAVRNLYLKAGFKQVHLMDEAIAAGVLGMYGQLKDKPNYKMLVYDMGGGTTSATLLEVENVRTEGMLEIRPRVLGVAGDPNLGGRDLTELLVQDILARSVPSLRAGIPWPGQAQGELENLARKNQRDLFDQAESQKLKLFSSDAPRDAPIPWTPMVWLDPLKNVTLGPVDYSSESVEALIRGRIEAFWRRVEDLIQVQGEGFTLDVLYLAGRSSQLPLIRQGLPRHLTRGGRFPRLEVLLAEHRNRAVVLKEAVSLGACLAADLVLGSSERLVLGRLEDCTMSRIGLRDQGGSFDEVLPPGSKLGAVSKHREVRLATPRRSDLFEARFEFWENPSSDSRLDGNPEAEYLGVARIQLTSADIDPNQPVAQVGFKLERDRTLKVVVECNGRSHEVPVEP